MFNRISATLLPWLIPLLAVNAFSECTLQLGFSQVSNWYINYERNPVVTGYYQQFGNFPPGQWSLWDNQNESFWAPGGFVEWWADPNYVGWVEALQATRCRATEGLGPVSPEADRPSRIVINVVSQNPDPNFVAQKVLHVIALARARWGTQARIILQPVVGGPFHAVCGNSWKDTAAKGVQVSRWHLVADTALAIIYNQNLAPGVEFGPDVVVEVPCSQAFKDYRGHLTNSAALWVARQMFYWYSQ